MSLVEPELRSQDPQATSVFGVESTVFAEHGRRDHHAGWIDEALATVKQALFLDDNWDHMGAAKPSANSVATVVSYLQFCLGQPGIAPPSLFAPTSDGGFVFEWEREGIVVLTMDIDSDGSTEFDPAV